MSVSMRTIKIGDSRVLESRESADGITIRRRRETPDGKRFMKNQEYTDAFVQTEAYSDLFMELATNADAAAAFVNGIVPQQK